MPFLFWLGFGQRDRRRRNAIAWGDYSRATGYCNGRDGSFPVFSHVRRGGDYSSSFARLRMGDLSGLFRSPLPRIRQALAFGSNSFHRAWTNSPNSSENARPRSGPNSPASRWPNACRVCFESPLPRRSPLASAYRKEPVGAASQPTDRSVAPPRRRAMTGVPRSALPEERCRNPPRRRSRIRELPPTTIAFLVGTASEQAHIGNSHGLDAPAFGPSPITMSSRSRSERNASTIRHAACMH